jgi:hypothetical protein
VWQRKRVSRICVIEHGVLDEESALDVWAFESDEVLRFDSKNATAGKEADANVWHNQEQNKARRIFYPLGQDETAFRVGHVACALARAV